MENGGRPAQASGLVLRKPITRSPDFHWPRFLSSSTRSKRLSTLRLAPSVFPPRKLGCCDISIQNHCVSVRSIAVSAFAEEPPGPNFPESTSRIPIHRREPTGRRKRGGRSNTRPKESNRFLATNLDMRIDFGSPDHNKGPQSNETRMDRKSIRNRVRTAVRFRGRVRRARPPRFRSFLRLHPVVLWKRY